MYTKKTAKCDQVSDEFIIRVALVAYRLFHNPNLNCNLPINEPSLRYHQGTFCAHSDVRIVRYSVHVHVVF